MKKTLLLLGLATTMFIGAQSFAACPCPDNCETNCCPCKPKCECTWWKIFEDKSKCYRCNNECDGCLSAKRAHWYKFWTDRCVVSNVNCEDCCKKCN